MSENFNGRKNRKKVDYNYTKYYSEEDFQKWKQMLKIGKNWHMKQKNVNGFTWYEHNCARDKRDWTKRARSDPEFLNNRKEQIICEYSKNEDKSCEGKMKVPLEPSKSDNKYQIKLNEDGLGHFIKEFEKFFKENKNNQTELSSSGSSSENEIMENILGKQEKDKWNEVAKLADLFMENAEISPQQIPNKLINHPPEIISVSEDNDRINWGKLKNNQNLKMVIARSTFGLKLDKEFYYNYRSMTSANFKQIGVYHHFLGGVDSPTPEEQLKKVKKVLEEVKFEKKKHLFGVAIQTEYNADADPNYFTAKLVKFVNLLYQNGFMRPIIYCNNNSWKKLITPSAADEIFSKLPLWIAHFTNDPSPAYPDIWKLRGIQWWMWQYKDDEVVDGIVNHVYCSRRNEKYIIQDDLFCSAV